MMCLIHSQQFRYTKKNHTNNVKKQDNKQIEDVTYVQKVEENGPKKSLPWGDSKIEFWA
mgnify:CR=1 FL=1